MKNILTQRIKKISRLVKLSLTGIGLIGLLNTCFSPPPFDDYFPGKFKGYTNKNKIYLGSQIYFHKRGNAFLYRYLGLDSDSIPDAVEVFSLDKPPQDNKFPSRYLLDFNEDGYFQKNEIFIDRARDGLNGNETRPILSKNKNKTQEI